MCLELKQHAAI